MRRTTTSALKGIEEGLASFLVLFLYAALGALILVLRFE
jgi:hypothetical protein